MLPRPQTRPSQAPDVQAGAELAYPGDQREAVRPRKDVLDTGSDPTGEPEPEFTPGAAPQDDHDLVRRAQAGEEPAFEALVRRHQGRAWRVARNLVPSDEDAQDVVQEAFVRVFKNLAGFDFAYPFPTWLYRIVTNLAIDHLRRRRPAVSTSSADMEEADWDMPDPHAPPPSRALERQEIAGEVHDVLASLAPHFQSVLVLRELEGLPCTEIARIVGATHVTVRWRLHRGRKLFQEEWERRARLRQRGQPAGAEARQRGTARDVGTPEGNA